MSDLILRLDLYPDLSPEERAAVDLEVAARPDLAMAHAEARHLATLLDAARRPEGDIEAAVRAFDRRLTGDKLRRMDPDVQPETNQLEAHLDALMKNVATPPARLEALNGCEGPIPSTPGDGSVSNLRLLDLEVAAPAPRRTRWVPRLAAAVALLAVGYGGAAALSAGWVSERTQVADLDHIEAIGMPVLRGVDVTPNETRAADALQAVLDARRSTLTLFPRYDEAALEAAAADLEDVSNGVAYDSWVSQEVRLVQGRVLVHLGRDVEAARVLGELVREGEYRSAAARRLLDYVRSAEREGG